MSAHDFTFRAIDGGTVELADFKGKPVLVVNTASKCAYTPQYGALEMLWRNYRERGLVVLGVPSNDFGAQEPGADPAIKSFCQANYGVDFPLTAKQAVIGGGAHPFYRWVVAELAKRRRRSGTSTSIWWRPTATSLVCGPPRSIRSTARSPTRSRPR